MRSMAVSTVTLGFILVLIACGGTVTPSNFTSPGATVSPSTSGGAASGNIAPAPVIEVHPAAVALGASQSTKFSAAVQNSANTAVIWSLTGCSANCGSIAQDGTYTAPASVPNTAQVKVVATLASNANYTSAAFVSLVPVTIFLSPASAPKLMAGAERFYQAKLYYDAANNGVVWSLAGPGCSGSACGTLNAITPTSVVYQAPAVCPQPPLITLKATSVTDSKQERIVPILLAASSTAYPLQGKYAFLVQGTINVALASEGAIAGNLDIAADGVVAGFWDTTISPAGTVTESISGTYSVGADGNGVLSLNSASGKWKFGVGTQSAGDAAVMWEEPTDTTADPTIPNASGYLLRQDANALNMTSVAGGRVVALTFSNTRGLGQFTVNPAGVLTGGVMDLTWTGSTLSFFTTVPLTGAFTPPDPLTGRGTATLGNYQFAYYIVSAERMLLVQVNPNALMDPLLRGEARLQKSAGGFSNASLAGAAVFSLASPDAGMWWSPMAILGRLDADGAGSLRQTYDGNQLVPEDRIVITLAAANTGSYSVEATGRVPMDIPQTPTNNYFPHTAVAYLVDANTGYLMREAVFGTLFGYFEPQSAASFTAQSLAGDYRATLTGPPRAFVPPNDAGSITLGPDGSASVFLALDRGAGLEAFAWTGTYVVDANGRGTMTLTDMNSGKAKSIVFWAVSPNKAIAILSTTPDDAYPILVQLQR